MWEINYVTLYWTLCRSSGLQLENAEDECDNGGKNSDLTKGKGELAIKCRDSPVLKLARASYSYEKFVFKYSNCVCSLHELHLMLLYRPVGTGGAGGASAPQYFATICSINFRENIARLYYKFAKIVTSSVTSYPFQSFIACSKNQCILDQER